MIARELDANLAGNLLIFGETSKRKKPKNELAPCNSVSWNNFVE